MQKIIKLIKEKKSIILYSLFYILATNVAFAALVPDCNPVGQSGAAGTCNFCHLMLLFNNIITFLLEAGVVIAALFFAWGAFVIMTAGGSPEKVKKGREVITIAITGVAIALASWLIVSTFLHIITGSESKLPWDQIKCTF